MENHWIRVREGLPPEEHYHVDGRNYLDKKDRDWTESDRVLVFTSQEDITIDSLRNGEWMGAKRSRNTGIETNVYDVVAWQPLPPRMDVEKDDLMLWDAHVFAMPARYNPKGHLSMEWVGCYVLNERFISGVRRGKVNLCQTGHDDYLDPVSAYKAAAEEAREYIKLVLSGEPRMECQ